MFKGIHLNHLERDIRFKAKKVIKYFPLTVCPMVSESNWSYDRLSFSS